MKPGSIFLILCLIVVVSFGLFGVATGGRPSRSDAWSASWESAPPNRNLTDLSANQLSADVKEKNDSWNETTPTDHHEDEVERFKVATFDFKYVQINLMISIWVFFASIAKIVFHSQKKLEKFFPESCLLIVIGVILGIILYFSIGDEHDYQLNVQIFFLILLPPIILDAGYFMPSRAFFDNFGTILIYAVIGTLLNTLLLGFSLWGVDQADGFGLDEPIELLQFLVFASLLAAVDPVAVLAVFESAHVNEVLHIVVFGESLLNDGISVVLYHMFEGFNEIGIHNIIAIDIISGIGSFFVIVFGAVSIGIVCGIVAGIISRFTRHARVMEPVIIVVVGYMSFLFAEMFHFSGILSCTFCGITMRKYVEVNISQKSQTTIKYLLKMMASVTETIIFMYLGISAVSNAHVWNTGFVLLTLVFCLVYRVLGVIILTWLANRVRLVRLNKIDQFIMAYGGLRGAIAFALVVLLDDEHFPQKSLFVTTTVVVIYFTNLIMGSTVKPLVNFLKVKKADQRQLNMNEKLSIRMMDHLMAGIEDLSGQKGHHLLRQRFSHFNNKYLKPIIVGRHHPSQKRGYEIFNVYKRLSMKDAKEMVKNPMSATSVSRMQTHLKRMSSVPEMNRGQLSVPDLRLYDISNWRYGPNPSYAELLAAYGQEPMANGHAMPNDRAMANGHAMVNGGLKEGLNIDRTSGRVNAKRPSVDNGGNAVESFDLSYNPARPTTHIYRRHMLSTASFPRFSDTEETPSSAEIIDSQHRRICFFSDPDTAPYRARRTDLGPESPLFSDFSFSSLQPITFNVQDDYESNGTVDFVADSNDVPSSSSSKRNRASAPTSRERRNAIQSRQSEDRPQYELQQYASSATNPYHDGQFYRKKKSPRHKSNRSVGFVNEGFSISEDNKEGNDNDNGYKFNDSAQNFEKSRGKKTRFYLNSGNENGYYNNDQNRFDDVNNLESYRF